MKKLMIAMAAVAMVGAANAELFMTGMAVYAEKDTAPSMENAEAWYTCYAMKLSDAKTMSGATDFSAITTWLGNNFAVNSATVKNSLAAIKTEFVGNASSDPGVSVAYYSFGQLVTEELVDVIAFCFFNNGTDEAYKVMGDLNRSGNSLADYYVGSSAKYNSDYSSGWQAVNVPEPTSGLLMLLGMAGLALKRKQRG